jgi:hypothetical protein
MLPELVLQFFVLCFCKQGKRKHFPHPRKKEGKSVFQLVLATVAAGSEHPGFWESTVL